MDFCSSAISVGQSCYDQVLGAMERRGYTWFVCAAEVASRWSESGCWRSGDDGNSSKLKAKYKLGVVEEVVSSGDGKVRSGTLKYVLMDGTNISSGLARQEKCPAVGLASPC